MSLSWAAMRRGDVVAVEQFCAQSHIVAAAKLAETWLTTQPHERLLRACLDVAARETLAEQLAQVNCGDVWFLTTDGEIVLGVFATPDAAYDVTAWLLRSRGQDDETPLTTTWMLSVLAFDAAMSGHVDALELLLASPISSQGYTEEEYQSLFDQIARAWATSRTSERAVEIANLLLAHGCSIECLHRASGLGSDEVNRVLVSHGSYLCGLDTSSAGVSRTLHPAYLRALVEAGADPRAGGPFSWHRIILTGTVDAVQMLVVDWGLDVDARVPAKREWTPLMFAAVQKHGVSIIPILLESGADLTLTDKFGCTALTIAAMIGMAAVVELLLSRGADPNHVDKQGKTALDHVPSRCLDTVELLRQYGARAHASRAHAMTEVAGE